MPLVVLNRRAFARCKIVLLSSRSQVLLSSEAPGVRRNKVSLSHSLSMYEIAVTSDELASTALHKVVR